MVKNIFKNVSTLFKYAYVYIHIYVYVTSRPPVKQIVIYYYSIGYSYFLLVNLKYFNTFYHLLNLLVL